MVIFVYTSVCVFVHMCRNLMVKINLLEVFGPLFYKFRAASVKMSMVFSIEIQKNPKILMESDKKAG